MKEEISIFDFLKDLSYEKKDLSSKPLFDKSYNPFMVNRFLSMSPQTIFFANFITRYPDIPKHLQYQFYLKMIDKQKIFFKYQKKDKRYDSSAVNKIKLVYRVSTQKAYEILEILSDEQIKKIEKSFGGRK